MNARDNTITLRVQIATHLDAAGEEIMVNTPYDVFTLPLQPSGLLSGPRFVVHVPGPEQPTAPSAPVGVDDGINVPAAKALIKIVGPGFKVIYRDAFRWKDASGGVLPNHYEMFSAETLARDFGYDLALDLGYAAILRDPSTLSQQPAAPSGEAGAFDANFLRSVASLCRAAYDLCQPKPQRTPEDVREHHGELCLLELKDIADEIERRLAAVNGAIDKARFKRAPCYLCGYNGPGYYQPDTHPCAAKYHAALTADLAAQHKEPTT